MKNHLLAPLALLALLFVLPLATGCQHEAPADADADSTAIRLAVLPTADCLPFYVADSLGLFDSLGVSVRLTTYEAAMDADTAFRGTSADGIVTDVVKAVTWRSEGDSLRAVMCAPASLRLVTARTARIREAKSLKEKVIGITRNSVTDYWLDRILEDNGLQPKDLNRPQINDIALRSRMVDQNQYDGAILPEPYASLSMARGGKRVADSARSSLLNPAVALVFHEKYIESHKAELRLLLQAYDAAVAFINGRRAQAEPGLWTFLPLRAAVPDSVAAVPEFQPASAELPDSLLSKVRTWCRSRNLLGNDTARVTLKLDSVAAPKTHSRTK